MSRKFWIITISLGVLVILMAAAGVAAYFLIPHFRSQRNITQARAFAAEGDLRMSRHHYEQYLYENPRDIEVLEEYIDICESVETDRSRSLTTAGRAYTRLAQLEPENPARKEAVLDFYRSHQLWNELENAIGLLYSGDLTDDLAYDKAVAVQMQGRISVAEDEFEAYLGLTGEREGAPLKDAPLRLTHIYREMSKAREIEPMFSALGERYAKDGMLAVNYAGYLLNEERVDEAAAQLAMVAEEVRNELDYLLLASRIAAAQGKSEEALELARSAVNLEPENADANGNLVTALVRRGDRDAAIAHLESLDPMYRLDNPGFMQFLVELKLDSSDTEGAEAIRERYAAAYPDYRHVDEYLKGRIAHTRSGGSRDGYTEARGHFIRALELYPNLDRARLYLATTELELENWPGARIALEKYLDNNPTDMNARRIWDRYFGEQKTPVELSYAARKLLDEERPDVDELVFNGRTILEAQIENADQLAVQLFEKAIEVDPADQEGYTALAAYYLGLQDLDSAERVLAQANENGINPSAFPLLEAAIKLSRGDVDEAMEIAKGELEGANFNAVQNWTTIFGNAGFVDEAGDLLQAYIDGGGDAVADAYELHLSLALRFVSLEKAMTLLEKAETQLAGDEKNLSILNGMRLGMVRALIVQESVDMEAVNALLQKVEESDPDSDGLTVARARLALNKEIPDYPMVSRTMNAIPESSPAYDDAQLLLAELAYRQGNYDEVTKIAKRVLERSPRSTSALYFLGEGQHGLGQIAEARATMEQIIEIDRYDFRAMYKLVGLYADLGLHRQADEMLARYKNLVSRDPDATDNVEELQAHLDRVKGDLAQSEDALRTKLESNPENYAAMNGLVQSLVAQGRIDEATQTVEAFLETNPSSAEAWVLLGQVILEAGPNADLAKASTAFTRAQVIVPNHGPAQLGLVDVNIRENNVELAISMCRRYLAKRPNDVDVLFRLASILSSNPATQPEALELVNRAFDSGDRLQLLRLRAYLLTQLDRPQEAIADIERVKAVGANGTPDDDLTLAEAYLALPDLEKARESLAAARANNTEDNPRFAARADNIEARIGASEGSQ